MEAPDYPIRFFQDMLHLANELKALRAQVMECKYSYESFGSWWLTFRRSGVTYRLVLDGKEGSLTMQKSQSRKHPHLWSEPFWEVPAPSAGTIDFDQLVGAIAKLNG